MIRIYKDNVVPAYPTGTWSWNKKNDKVEFLHWDKEIFSEEFEVKSSSGYNFKPYINQMEEVIYNQEFARPETTMDPEVIIIQDIKNLVLFLAPSEMLNPKLLNFLHTKTVDWFLNALIIYFEYYIRLVEYILVRRDECLGKSAQIESSEAFDIKRVYSEYLTEYRILLAREYSVILMGNDEMKPYYHITPVTNISKTLKDKLFHESFLAICTQIVWIAHHRRGYDVIDDEMNRLFRSHHFQLNRRKSIEFSRVEQQLLYGVNDHRVNCRYQNSPIIQELARLRPRNSPLLWIGYKKYRGNDLRLQQLELEFVVPGSQLVHVHISHGILGHPKKVYNTLLSLVWDALREQEYNELYDPYQFITQPHLVIPDLNALKQERICLDSYFYLTDNRYEYIPELIKKWTRRDKIIAYIMGGGKLYDIVARCRQDLEDTANRERPSSMEVTTALLKHRQKWLKLKRSIK